jgi:type III restriction enzyme
MTGFTPKTYQQQVLDSIEAYFKACHELPSPSIAFTATTERLWGRGNPYNPLSGFPPDMPYFCLRVPTGGGKTWLAAKSVALVNTHLLRSEHSVILWLVPSKPIREQTLKALKDRHHPYHAALREAGPVTVLDLEEAKSVTRATLDTSTTVIVATRQAFQVEEEECRKVYQSSGALMHHFEHLSPVQRDALLKEGEGPDATTPYSLANVLRLRRPFVIVDEAHNSRTELAFDMLARFRPSGVMELTATPDLERTPSNVLHSVSAAELKAEEMIKLPVVLETEPNWQQCLADAIARRDALHKLADEERRAGAPYLRPLVLIQAEPRRAGVETLDVEKIKNELITHHGIPASEIVVATGEEKGLEQIAADYKLGLSDPACPVKFVITQKALAEGWDCPFAYILVSMAELRSATAVEQLLGRILRQPGCGPSAGQGAQPVVCLRGVAQLCRNRQRPTRPAGGGRGVRAARGGRVRHCCEGRTSPAGSGWARRARHCPARGDYLVRKARPEACAQAGARQGELGRQAQHADNQNAADRGRGRSAQGLGHQRNRCGGHRRGRRDQPHHGDRVFPDTGRVGRALARAATGLACAGRVATVR